MSLQNLSALALNAAGARTSGSIVNLLWKNLFGAEPSAAQAAPYVSLLDSGQHTPGSLGALAADLGPNKININLVGLQTVGLDYL